MDLYMYPCPMPFARHDNLIMTSQLYGRVQAQKEQKDAYPWDTFALNVNYV